MKNTFTSLRRCNKLISSEILNSSWPWAVFGVSLFVLLNIYRLRAALPQAGLRMEDVFYFNTYYDHAAPFLNILHKNAGQPYLIPLTNFLAWLIACFDVRIQPYMYQWTGFLMATVAVSLPFFSGMIRSKPVAVLGPLLLGLVGLNHAFYSLTLIYTMYTGVIAALCMLFFDAPKTRVGTIFFTLAMIFLPWFGPYSVLIIPAGLLLLVLFPEDKKKRLLLFVVLCSTGLYYLIGVDRGTSNILHLKQLWIIKTYLHYLLENIILLGLVDKVSLYFWYPVLFLLAAIFYALRKDHQYLKYSLVLFALISLSLLLIFASNRYPLILYLLPCHMMISLFFWVLFLLFTIDRLFMAYGNSGTGIVFFMICTVILVSFDNTRHPEKWAVRPIKQQKEFLAAIHYCEGLNLAEHNEYVVLKLKNHPDTYWKPKVTVGSRMAGRQLISKEALLNDRIEREFVVEKNK